MNVRFHLGLHFIIAAIFLNSWSLTFKSDYDHVRTAQWIICYYSMSALKLWMTHHQTSVCSCCCRHNQHFSIRRSKKGKKTKQNHLYGEETLSETRRRPADGRVGPFAAKDKEQSGFITAFELRESDRAQPSSVWVCLRDGHENPASALLESTAPFFARHTRRSL